MSKVGICFHELDLDDQRLILISHETPKNRTGCISQWGKLFPIILRRENEKNLLCRVALVEVHKSERTACNVSGSTVSQELLGSCFVFKISCTVFQTLWLILSH